MVLELAFSTPPRTSCTSVTCPQTEQLYRPMRQRALRFSIARCSLVSEQVAGSLGMRGHDELAAEVPSCPTCMLSDDLVSMGKLQSLHDTKPEREMVMRAQQEVRSDSPNGAEIEKKILDFQDDSSFGEENHRTRSKSEKRTKRHVDEWRRCAMPSASSWRAGRSSIEERRRKCMMSLKAWNFLNSNGIG